MGPGSLTEVLRAHLTCPDAVNHAGAADVEHTLAEVVRAGALAWPGVELAAEAFVGRIATHYSNDGSLVEWLRGVRAEDLFLATACAERAPNAIDTFDREFLDSVPAILVRGGMRDAPADEIRQRVRERLFVGAAKIADYSGRGALRAGCKSSRCGSRSTRCASKRRSRSPSRSRRRFAHRRDRPRAQARSRSAIASPSSRRCGRRSLSSHERATQSTEAPLRRRRDARTARRAVSSPSRDHRSPHRAGARRGVRRVRASPAGRARDRSRGVRGAVDAASLAARAEPVGAMPGGQRM